MKICVNQEQVPEDLIRRQMQNWQQQHPGSDEATAFAHVSPGIIEWTLIGQQAETHSPVSPQDVDAEFQALCKQHGGQAAFLQRVAQEAGKSESMVKADLKRHRQSTRFLDELAKDVPPPTDAMVAAYYQTHSQALVHPERVHAAHIVKHPQSEADELAAAAELTAIRKRLLHGEDFFAVANATSDCNDSPPDLGEFPRGKMVPEFELVVFSMNPGEISPVFKTPFGLHVATVVARKAPVGMTMSEAAPHIHASLLQEARNTAIRTWVQTQKEQADLHVVPPAPSS